MQISIVDLLKTEKFCPEQGTGINKANPTESSFPRQSTVPSTYQCGILLDLIPTPLAKVPFMAGESNRLDPLLAHGTVRGDHKDPTAFLQLARPCQMARSRF
ncbi:hypothetical protein RRG08_034262 [Elysia crispata]|uniref:Uncharacterized protein n=1 Tax=Elysia crispata TaxID=231223 RepID=A0AAE1A0A2_9GAST|nr:hypothetical protein RRG08_034262 [Elysia crispata]